MKVKIIVSDRKDDFEEKINSFIDNVSVKDIRYIDIVDRYSCLIMYWEQTG